MNNRRERAGFPFPAASFTVFAGGIFGFYVCLALCGGSKVCTPLIYAAGSLSGAVACLIFWSRIYIRRGRRIALSACISYSALLIPAFFFPDYFIGHGPQLHVSFFIASIAVMCFLTLRFMVLSPTARAFEERISKASLKITVAATSLFVICTIIYGMARFANFAYAGNDLGNFIQSFWTALHGKLFWNTQEFYPGGSHFGKHFSPVMFLVLLFFSLCPHFITLLSLTAVCLGLGGVVVYFLARDSAGGYAGLCFAACFFLYPGIAYPAREAYFMMHYAPLFLLLALYYFTKEKICPFCLFIILACSIREEIALTTFMFGIYAALERRRAAWVLVPMVLSTVWFAVSVGIVIPAFGTGPMHEFYADTGGSPAGVILSFFNNPVAILSRFVSPDYLKFIYLMLMPLAVVLPLLGPEILLALPSLLIIALSSMDQTRSIHGYYYMPLIPFIFSSSIAAVKNISAKRILPFLKEREMVNLLSTFVLFLSLAVFARGPLSETITRGVTRPYNVRAGRGYNETLKRVIELIPPEASVFTPRYMMPHLARRMFVVPDIPYDAEYLIIDSLTADLSTAKIQEDGFIETLDENSGFVKIFDESGVKLYRRLRP